MDFARARTVGEEGHGDADALDEEALKAGHADEVHDLHLAEAQHRHEWHALLHGEADEPYMLGDHARLAHIGAGLDHLLLPPRDQEHRLALAQRVEDGLL